MLLDNTIQYQKDVSSPLIAIYIFKITQTQNSAEAFLGFD